MSAVLACPCPPGLQAFRHLRTDFCFRETVRLTAGRCRLVSKFSVVIVVPRFVSSGTSPLTPSGRSLSIKVERNEKTADPRSGDERCQARGTTPLCHGLAARDLYLYGGRWQAYVRDTVVRVTGNLTRRRLLRVGFRVPNPVRDEARRSFSPAFLVPLLSFRGSLSRSGRLLVLVNACRDRLSTLTIADSLAIVNAGVFAERLGCRSVRPCTPGSRSPSRRADRRVAPTFGKAVRRSPTTATPGTPGRW